MINPANAPLVRLCVLNYDLQSLQCIQVAIEASLKRLALKPSGTLSPLKKNEVREAPASSNLVCAWADRLDKDDDEKSLELLSQIGAYLEKELPREKKSSSAKNGRKSKTASNS